MAGPQKRRRQRADEPSQHDNASTNDREQQHVDERSQDDHQSKRPRRAAEHPNPWQYPPEFWDRLSKIPLIRSALEELARRTCTRPSRPPPSTGLAQDLAPTVSRELARFSRHGGPDLQDLRGYPLATSNHQPPGAMRSSSQSQAAESDIPTTLPTASGVTTVKKTTTPYHLGFEQHLTDKGVHSIHPPRRPGGPDLEEVMAAIAVPRSSLSLSSFSDAAFEAFVDIKYQAKDEDDVKADVIPTISGPRQANHFLARNTVFGNLEPLTDGTLAPAVPDMYYGAYPDELDQSIRSELAGHIIPSTMQDKPMAPNFFVEVKGPSGSTAVAKRQARYDGAIGSRGIQSLQNYGREKPQYDGHAYTFTSICHDGLLQLYAHHVTAPTTEGGRPQYHMTKIRRFDLEETREAFIQGATAFRNLRDLAKRYRDRFIQAANARARQMAAPAAQEDPCPISDELHEAVDRSDCISLMDDDAAPQEHIDIASIYVLEDPDLASDTSSLSTAKRPRQSPSSPSSPRASQRSKSRKPPNTARRTAE